jgi:hypothetical protein
LLILTFNFSCEGKTPSFARRGTLQGRQAA